MCSNDDKAAVHRRRDTRPLRAGLFVPVPLFEAAADTSTRKTLFNKHAINK